MGSARRTHVALLRGVNVLGRNKLSMPVLRELIESLGHSEVATYIQSGNVAFAAARSNVDDQTIANEFEVLIGERTGLKPAVIVVGAAQLERVVRDNPFPEVSDHRLLHGIFLKETPGRPELASVAAAVERAREKGSRDDARVVGRVLYLSTPDGFAPSVLRRELDRGGANRTPVRDGSARNWRTVNALVTLVGR